MFQQPASSAKTRLSRTDPSLLFVANTMPIWKYLKKPLLCGLAPLESHLTDIVLRNFISF